VNKRHLYFLAGSLTAIGLILFYYKLVVMDFPLVPELKTYIWNIQAHLTFEAGNKAELVNLDDRVEFSKHNFEHKG
jgi:hypothetical protein